MTLSLSRWAAVPLLAALPIASLARAGDDCVVFPEGDFENGQGAWQFTPDETASGDANATVTFNIIDGSDIVSFSGLMPFDEQTLQVLVLATAGTNDGAGDAEATGTASLETIAGGPTLRISRGGGFEYLFFGDGLREIEVLVEVTGPRGETATGFLVEGSPTQPGTACQPGISILGTLDGDPPYTYVDLAGAGIELGDPIEVAIVARAVAGAVPCQYTESIALLLVDDVSFCGPLSSPYDLDGSGTVDGADLGILLGAWGFCGDCPADFNGDGFVDGADLGQLLGNWG